MLLDGVRASVPFIPYINTGTLFDLAIGKFRPSVDGGWVLDGGLSPCMGLVGRAQTYKSTLAASLIVRAMEIHETAEAYIYETEGAVSGPERYDMFVSTKGTTVSDRIAFKTSAISSLSDFYDDFRNIVENKLAHKDDYIVKSPFLDARRQEPHRVWIPTFVFVDSFSRAKSDKSEQQYDGTAIDDSSLNNMFLMDGNFKTRIMSDLPIRASKAGIYTVLTAHIGNKMDMNVYAPSPKQLQYMRNSDKIKNVGSNFEFLTSVLLQTMRASVMQDSAKACEYPCEGSSAVEVNKIDTTLVRCKNNASGLQLSFVVSQYQGILDAVTDFVFLKDNKSPWLDNKGNRTYNTKIAEDKKFMRTNIRDLCDKDYGLTRALELTAQLHFLQNYYSSWQMPEYFNMPMDKFLELLDKSESLTTDRILQSTGVWTTSTQERERLTILDVLQILAGDEAQRNAK